jgi:hypothetical protein
MDFLDEDRRAGACCRGQNRAAAEEILTFPRGLPPNSVRRWSPAI